MGDRQVNPEKNFFNSQAQAYLEEEFKEYTEVPNK